MSLIPADEARALAASAHQSAAELLMMVANGVKGQSQIGNRAFSFVFPLNAKEAIKQEVINSIQGAGYQAARTEAGSSTQVMVTW